MHLIFFNDNNNNNNNRNRNNNNNNNSSNNKILFITWAHTKNTNTQFKTQLFLKRINSIIGTTYLVMSGLKFETRAICGALYWFETLVRFTALQVFPSQHAVPLDIVTSKHETMTT